MGYIAGQPETPTGVCSVMAMITIVLFVFAIVFGYLAYMLFTPILADVRYENAMWDDMPTDVLAFGDQIHGIWLMIGVVIIAIAVMTGISKAMQAGAS